ncbi:MAG: ATP-binding cassette domain-containing protein [Desulfoplanes sp.]|nr:ATP-binding cassette domain-containing protein [Desulfoplanes sp.]
MVSQIELTGVTKRFASHDVPALHNVTVDIQGNQVTGVVGPDGAGKTTLLRLMAGLLVPSMGRLMVAGQDTTTPSPALRERVSYMPQRFGLYEDLTVMENLTLYADLRNVLGADRHAAVEHLLAFTGLAPWTTRRAGNLSGGMKQKLGLACSLIQRPQVLLLDEPSVGVDPLSRRELWHMVYTLVEEGITVVWSTAYLDEAERCSRVLVLNEGNLLYEGPPDTLTRRMSGRTFLVTMDTARRRHFAADALKNPLVLDSVIQGHNVRLVMEKGTANPGVPFPEIIFENTEPRFEDAFMSLLSSTQQNSAQTQRRTVTAPITEPPTKHGQIIAEARSLAKRFGSFTAVDTIDFNVRQGEVFGLLGPNGAGKSTIFKMMCGLLKPSAGKARVAGVDLLKAPARARERIGYMAQKFSLYGTMSVRQNLEFFAGVYGLAGNSLKNAVARMVEDFQLESYIHTNGADLPLGFKQRLSMACATMHQPAILFLDEPTSGVDPITRREFWARINTMVERGVAIIVTTHFLDEAEYCDRIALIYRGKIIAADTPDGIKHSAISEHSPKPTLEEAFIELIQRDMPVQAHSLSAS